MKFETANFLTALVQRLLTKLEKLMSAQTDALQALINSLIPAIQTAISQEGALKTKLDAAVADNVAKTAEIARLEAALAAAQGAPPNPADAQAVVAMTTSLAPLVQALTDANAVNAPSN